MTASKIFLYFCLSFIGGIFLSSIFLIPQLILLGVLILGILLISIFGKYKKFVIIGFCLLFLVLGIWRYQLAQLKILNSKLRNYTSGDISSLHSKYNNREEVVSLIGIVIQEPDIREKTIKSIIEVENLEGETINEKILVTAWRYPEYKYGDKLKIRGKLENPQEFEGFNYKDYLAKDGIYLVMNFPEIELISRDGGIFLFKSLFSFKEKLKESLNKVMPRLQSVILEALFFGEEGNISKEWKEKLNLTGTRHITAVSGMNITIITFLLLNFLLILGFWRNQAFYFSIILIMLYILMIGAPASAVRAGIMAGLFLLAQHFGRVSAGSRAIVFAATLMLAFNPLLLKSDVGFQLSFLAILGLIYLQPIFLDLFKKIPNFLQLRNNLAATLAAQIFVLPILVYNFGQISIISPLTNILILPLIPLIAILGFIFSFIGIFWRILGQILSWPAWFLLTYILKIIDWFSKISWTTLTLKNIHWIFIIISYLILGGIVFWLNKKQKLKFLNY